MLPSITSNEAQITLTTADGLTKEESYAIAGKVADMGQYDTVFVGFPIWWYQAPRIIETFLESYDFSGKTVIPFATSGGSGMGKTNSVLKPSCGGAKLLEGKVVRRGTSKSDLAAWAERL